MPRGRSYEGDDSVRLKIEKRATELGLTWKALSKRLDAGITYMYDFMWRDRPATLPEDIRIRLAQILDLPEDELRHSNTLRANPGPAPAAGSGPNKKVFVSYTAADEARARRLLPVFMDTTALDPARSLDLIVPPEIEGIAPLAFGLWITTPRAGFRVGDQVWLHRSRPARTGDLALLVRENAVAGLGELLASPDTETLTVREAGGDSHIPRDGTTIYKVALTIHG